MNAVNGWLDELHERSMRIVALEVERDELRARVANQCDTISAFFRDNEALRARDRRIVELERHLDDYRHELDVAREYGLGLDDDDRALVEARADLDRLAGELARERAHTTGRLQALTRAQAERDALQMAFERERHLRWERGATNVKLHDLLNAAERKLRMTEVRLAAHGEVMEWAPTPPRSQSVAGCE